MPKTAANIVAECALAFLVTSGAVVAVARAGDLPGTHPWRTMNAIAWRIAMTPEHIDANDSRDHTELAMKRLACFRRDAVKKAALPKLPRLSERPIVAQGNTTHKKQHRQLRRALARIQAIEKETDDYLRGRSEKPGWYVAGTVFEGFEEIGEFLSREQTALRILREQRVQTGLAASDLFSTWAPTVGTVAAPGLLRGLIDLHNQFAEPSKNFNISMLMLIGPPSLLLCSASIARLTRVAQNVDRRSAVERTREAERLDAAKADAANNSIQGEWLLQGSNLVTHRETLRRYENLLLAQLTGRAPLRWPPLLDGGQEALDRSASYPGAIATNQLWLHRDRFLLFDRERGGEPVMVPFLRTYRDPPKHRVPVTQRIGDYLRSLSWEKVRGIILPEPRPPVGPVLP